MRALLFGDVGGHYLPFAAALQKHGIDMGSMQIPADIVVVQVGDLVHRGPHGDKAVAMADAFMAKFPDQWLQVLGNHEMMHMPGAVSFFACRCSDGTVATIREWVKTRKAVVACAFQGAPQGLLTQPETLVSHAGVSSYWWNSSGRGTAAETAAYLNSFLPGQLDKLDRYGVMMTGQRTSKAGPWWAAASDEVYPSWHNVRMPFNQVHGHTSPFMWDHDAWFPSTPRLYRDSLERFPLQRASALRGKDGTGSFVGIDPAYGASQSQRVMSHLVIDGVTLSR